MEWMQAIMIILSIAGLIQWFRSDIKSDMSRMETDLRQDLSRLENDVRHIAIRIDANIVSQNARMDQLYQMFDANIIAQNTRFDKQNTRMDQLYQMFVDLLKEGKK